ncbi:AAA family ATPase [Marisediminicola senii]|uniref:AAA family ATPase n=1 Tax=Marisediminicola senii TaxID=2711233 RepID=UPI0013ED9573|nr:ATP-binding protein [Marisediminicola senii]
MLIAMAGLPGTGKSTLAGHIGARLGAAVVSVDPIEAAILTAGIDRDQPTGLAAYLVAETIAQSVLSAGQTIVVDAVNAVGPAREQWVALAERAGVPLRFVETTCSDHQLHRERLEARVRLVPEIAEPTRHAVEQSLEEYGQWEGVSATVPRLSVDTAKPVETNVASAIAFLAG